MAVYWIILVWNLDVVDRYISVFFNYNVAQCLKLKFNIIFSNISVYLVDFNIMIRMDSIVIDDEKSFEETPKTVVGFCRFKLTVKDVQNSSTLV